MYFSTLLYVFQIVKRLMVLTNINYLVLSRFEVLSQLVCGWTEQLVQTFRLVGTSAYVLS